MTLIKPTTMSAGLPAQRDSGELEFKEQDVVLREYADALDVAMQQCASRLGNRLRALHQEELTQASLKILAEIIEARSADSLE